MAERLRRATSAVPDGQKLQLLMICLQVPFMQTVSAPAESFQHVHELHNSCPGCQQQKAQTSLEHCVWQPCACHHPKGIDSFTKSLIEAGSSLATASKNEVALVVNMCLRMMDRADIAVHVQDSQDAQHCQESLGGVPVGTGPMRLNGIKTAF